MIIIYNIVKRYVQRFYILSVRNAVYFDTGNIKKNFWLNLVRKISRAIFRMKDLHTLCFSLMSVFDKATRYQRSTNPRGYNQFDLLNDRCNRQTERVPLLQRNVFTMRAYF